MKTNSSLLLIISFIFLFGCEKENDIENSDSKTSEIYAINLEKTDANFDFCFIHNDGSYAAFYIDTAECQYAIQVGASIENVDTNNAYNIILDNNGYPQVLTYDNYKIYFSNFSGNTFDAAINNSGEIQYLWGIEADIDMDSLINAMDLETTSLKTKSLATFNGLLDYIPQNSREMAILCSTVLKVAGVATSAVALVATTPAIIAGTATVATVAVGVFAGIDIVSYCLSETFNDEIFDRIGVGSDFSDFAFEFNEKGWRGGISLLISSINEAWYMTIMTNIDEEIQESLKDNDLRPYQIQLSRLSVITGCNTFQTTIEVTTESAWEIKEMTTDWCAAYKSSNNTITVDIFEEYPYPGSRGKVFIVYNPNDEDKIKPVSFTVIQKGFEYTLTPKSLDFEADPENKSQTLTIETGSDTVAVKSIKLDGDYNWCSLTWEQKEATSKATVTVTANEKEERTASILVTFKVGDHATAISIPITQAGIMDLLNTEWRMTYDGMESDGSFHIKFKSNNICTIELEETTSGLWEQTGNTVVFKFDSQGEYSIHYYGTIVSSDTIVGSCDFNIIDDGSAMLDFTAIRIDN